MAKDVLFFTLMYLLTVFSVNERPPASAALFASSSFSDSLSTLLLLFFVFLATAVHKRSTPPHAPRICTYTHWLRGPAGESYKIVRLLEMPLQMSMLCPKMSVIVG